MDTTKLKYVVGEAKEGQICDLRLFCEIDEFTANLFNEEFLWVEKCVKPSKIRVFINSPGGSVIHGMSIFSLIRNSTIPTECIIEGLAASMGSIIWAAADTSLMRDYAILMIHNPFNAEEEEEKESDSVKAFRQQIETIYMKRWGFSKTKVKELLAGKEGEDGTFFTAEEAVAAGIIPVENVLKTSKQKVQKVKNAIEGITDSTKLKDTITSVCNQISLNEAVNSENKHSFNDETNLNKTKQVENKTKTNNMNDNEETIDFNFGAVVASLGFTESTDVASVMDRITELRNVENKLKEANKTIDALKIEKEGEIAKNNQLSNDLEKTKAELQSYKDTEKKALDTQIKNMIQEAVDAGKIEDSAKQNWIDMANTNLELVKATLNSIPAREKISVEIENSEEKVKNVQDSLNNINDKIETVIGKDFKFKTLG